MLAEVELAFLAAEQGDIDEGFRPSQHREQTKKEDLVERVGYLALLARMGVSTFGTSASAATCSFAD